MTEKTEQSKSVPIKEVVWLICYTLTRFGALGFAIYAMIQQSVLLAVIAVFWMLAAIETKMNEPK